MNNKNQYLIALAVLLIGSFFYWHVCYNNLPNGLSGKWQAVFLEDGQVYFGKLSNQNSKYALLSNVYYLKINENLQQGGSASASLGSRNLNLIRLGGEAHGPESEMFISKEKILFVENLREDSSVLKAMNISTR